MSKGNGSGIDGEESGRKGGGMGGIGGEIETKE